MRSLKIDTAQASAFPQLDRSGLSLRHGGGSRGFAFEGVPPPPPPLQRSTNSQPTSYQQHDSLRRPQPSGGFFTDFSLPEQGSTYFTRGRSEVVATTATTTPTFFGSGTTAPANAFGGSTNSAWGLAGASSMAPQTLAAGPWSNTQPLGTTTMAPLMQQQQPPATLFSTPPAPLTNTAATPGFGSGLFGSTTVWPSPANTNTLAVSQPANPWTGAGMGSGSSSMQQPLGLNALGSNVQGGGLSYVGNGGVGLGMQQPLMSPAQQSGALGGWAAKPQLSFGFTGGHQQQQLGAALSGLSGGGNLFRPQHSTGLAGGGQGLFTFGAPMPQPSQQPISFNFGGAAQHNLTTGFGSSLSGLGPAPLFGSPPLASAQGFNGGGLSMTSAGTTPFSQQPPFDASRGFAWNMESFQKGVTGLSNYEAPASSTWAPPPPRLGAGNSYGLSNWGRWSGVAPEAGFGRPAEAGRSLLGQWVQPSTLFRHPLVPTAQAGMLARQSTLEPQALWGGGLPLGSLGYPHAGLWGYHSLDREVRHLQDRFRTLQVPLPDKASPLESDPLLRLVVYRSQPSDASRVVTRDGEEALYEQQEAGPGEDKERDGARRKRAGLHRKQDPLSNKIKMIRVAEPY